MLVEFVAFFASAYPGNAHVPEQNRFERVTLLT
jgi:hypothetical protein